MHQLNLKTVLMICVLALAGCVDQSTAPPRTLAEYEQVQRTNPQAYSQHVILQHNIQRLLDDDLKSSERVDSFQLVVRLAGDDPEIRKQMAMVLSDARAPLDVQQAVLGFMLNKDYPDLAGYVVGAMPNLTKHAVLRDAVLQWLAKHPTPAVQSEVVRLWSEEASPTGPNESRYREVLERISGKSWDQALLDGLNTSGFSSAGPAVWILASRLGQGELRDRLLKIKPLTEDVAALQTFLLRFDYLPANTEEFAALVQIYHTDAKRIDAASRLGSNWRQAYGYKFNIRDFHVLSHVADDPMRAGMDQPKLLGAIVQSLNTRQHVQYKPANTPAKDDRFWIHAKDLSVADLWNIYLLNDLLERPRIQLAMRILSDKDRDDKHSAFGGLVFYEAGQANAVQYQASYEAGEDDLTYVPRAIGKKGLTDYNFLADQHNSMGRFICHFEKVDNAARVGPTADELRDAAANNYGGVVFTTISADTFDAHYFNAAGEVISLGVFPLGK